MRLLVASLTSVLSISSFAAEETKPIQAEAEVGALITTGNTQSTAFKGKLDIKHNLDKWLNNYIVEAFYKENQVDIIIDDVPSTEDRVDAEKYFASAQSDYKLNEEHRGLFMFASYEEDKFSGYEYQGTIAAGYSDRLFKTENQQLLYNVGPGLALSTTDDITDANGIVTEEGVKSENVVLRISANYKWQITDHAKFTQTLSSEISPDTDKNTKTKAETALTTAINGSFALKAGFTVSHNSVVQPEFDKTDTQSSVTLVYTY
ncbi:DUF481 domain-containing protein [Teredinibacter franksiae]|uniref:DUF481 domain-containing protein n=1 Tax=Teredinibacter franksiae TaxID=2761453 RepID=UPI0016268140|nr:DUF481 domain-containing protein [Teredinibacter franksiae]